MNKPKYSIGDFIKADYLIIGIVQGVKWSTKVSEWNMKCGYGYEIESENEDMWLYVVDAIGHRKPQKVWENEIEGVIEVRR